MRALIYAEPSRFQWFTVATPLPKNCGLTLLDSSRLLFSHLPAGLFDDGLDGASVDEPEEVVSTSAEPPKWKIHHSCRDHRLNNMCTVPVLAELTVIGGRLYRPDTID